MPNQIYVYEQLFRWEQEVYFIFLF